MQNTYLQIILFIVDTLASLYIGAVLVRFLLQVARADFYNPLSQMIVKVTNPLLKPLRKVIPGFGGFDIAALVLAFLAQLIFLQLIMLIQGGSIGLQGGSVLIWAILKITLTLLNIYIISMFVVAIASFIAPGNNNPALNLMRQLIEPICAPARRFIPPMGGMDFSFMAVAMLIYILKIFVIGTAANYGIPL
ncbi:MAG: YggT family protein [Marinagarivorans sp.]|nr:YggT family protein [Marinagarivorans sp.]